MSRSTVDLEVCSSGDEGFQLLSNKLSKIHWRVKHIVFSHVTLGTHGRFLSWEPLLTFVARFCHDQLWNGKASKKEKEFRLHLPTLQWYIIELLVGIFSYVSHRILATSSGAHVLQVSSVKFCLKLQELLCWPTVAASNASWPHISWTPWEWGYMSILPFTLNFLPVVILYVLASCLGEGPSTPFSESNLSPLCCWSHHIHRDRIHHRWAFLWSLFPTDFFSWLDCCPNFPSFSRK